MKDLTKEYLEEAASKKVGKKEQSCEIESEAGRLGIKNGNALVPTHQPKERIYSKKYTEEQQRASVWNTVAVVQSVGNFHTLTDRSAAEVFRNLLTCLPSNKLLEKKNSVFFTDGARNLQKQIETIFSFHSDTIILDCYHMKKTMSGMVEHVCKRKKRAA